MPLREVTAQMRKRLTTDRCFYVFQIIRVQCTFGARVAIAKTVNYNLRESFPPVEQVYIHTDYHA